MLDVKENNCVNCEKPFQKVGKAIFCQRKCQNTYNARKRRELKSTEVYLDNCLKCKKKIKKPCRKFCSQACKNSHNQKHLYAYKYQKEYRSRSPENFIGQLLSYYKRRETLDKEFLIALYYKQGGRCAVTGETMTFNCATGRCHTNISIDRIDSSRGYEKENVRLVCHIINTMKWTMSDEELVDWCEKILYNKENGNPKDNSSGNLRTQSKSKNRSFARNKNAGKKK